MANLMTVNKPRIAWEIQSDEHKNLCMEADFWPRLQNDADLDPRNADDERRPWTQTWKRDKLAQLLLFEGRGKGEKEESRKENGGNVQWMQKMMEEAIEAEDYYRET